MSPLSLYLIGAFFKLELIWMELPSEINQFPRKKWGWQYFRKLVNFFHTASPACSQAWLGNPGEGKLTSPLKLNPSSLSGELVNFTLLLHLEQLGVLVWREIIGPSAWNPFTFWNKIPLSLLIKLKNGVPICLQYWCAHGHKPFIFFPSIFISQASGRWSSKKKFFLIPSTYWIEFFSQCSMIPFISEQPIVKTFLFFLV